MTISHEYLMKHSLKLGLGLGLWCLTPLSTIFQLYRGHQFIGEGNWSTWKKPSTWHELLKTLAHNVVSSMLCHERDSNSPR